MLRCSTPVNIMSYTRLRAFLQLWTIIWCQSNNSVNKNRFHTYTVEFNLPIAFLMVVFVKIWDKKYIKTTLGCVHWESNMLSTCQQSNQIPFSKSKHISRYFLASFRRAQTLGMITPVQELVPGSGENMFPKFYYYSLKNFNVIIYLLFMFGFSFISKLIFIPVV